ncbi:phosphatidylserine decarboxylase [Candidatus Woesearchaeota archaeon]|nr:phosphatidylserine decarboxylase [Candidatus Woesearchaeota archaeon]
MAFPTNLLLALLLGAGIYWYWKVFLFYRDPPRKIPKRDSLLSPADGNIVYIRPFSQGKIPDSVKKGKSIKLREITHVKDTIPDGYIIGIFMNPLSVHVNRSPIRGKVIWAKHFRHSNLSMASFLLRAVFGLHSSPGKELWERENERNTIFIRGKLPVYVIQIADSIVNRVVCWKKPGSEVKRGERIGIIKMGSQVDLILPKKFGKKNLKLLVKEGQYVHAGETPIANLLARDRK